MKFKKEKYVDPWISKNFKWPSKDTRKNQYAFHVGLLDKYSKNIPPIPKTLKQSWGTSNVGIKNYFKDTRGAAV